MARNDRSDELEFIRRWRGDDPWGRAAGRSRRARAEKGAEGAVDAEGAAGGAPDGAPDGGRGRTGRGSGEGSAARAADGRDVGEGAFRIGRADDAGARMRPGSGREQFVLFEPEPGAKARRRGARHREALRRDVRIPDVPDGPRVDLDAAAYLDEAPSAGDRPRLILGHPDADRSIRTAFPLATIDFPGGEYCRISHPLGVGASSDPELSQLPTSGLLFDLETLGFHGRPLFLIGILYPAVPPPASGPDAWRVVQLLARDYAEEEAILEAFADVAAEQTPWVSFNGKTFDLPFLRERARFHHLPLPEPREHLDLLHAARRVYKGVLPNCRLQTLESALFARYRYRDLPGDEIPAAYHDYVRTGEEEDMVRILRHNRDDLVTLARLHVHLGSA
ncbi:MAG: ribonuclease H-like domain-containing protein [Candidatus Eisenbacteria bacterium]|uniref:Ribonuclease H-like domain-containing protein n=1 Tax=Eiseniibacteriota bacterium TaxID=2212470 RepID=A0A956NF89_UNCEI|nr:ribonuclease H-like domain-containing protein [Candidatus Eisenbacteria bacterium]MCB9462421.1 ribonuclease H-like domain-containing protein [Candidatus Eisenbacteria bacterium]